MLREIDDNEDNKTINKIVADEEEITRVFKTHTIRGQKTHTIRGKDKKDFIFTKIRTYRQTTYKNIKKQRSIENQQKLEENFRKEILITYNYEGNKGRILEKIDNKKTEVNIELPKVILDAIKDSRAYVLIGLYLKS